MEQDKSGRSVEQIMQIIVRITWKAWAKIEMTDMKIKDIQDWRFIVSGPGGSAMT